MQYIYLYFHKTNKKSILLPILAPKNLGMKKLIFLLFSVSMMLQATAQNFLEEYNKYTNEGDTAKTASTLKAWNKANPKDSELFPAYLNFYFFQSRQEGVKFTDVKTENTVVVIQSKEKKDSAYMEPDINYNPEVLHRGIDWINKGIKWYPNRLDYHLGKAYAFSEINDWGNMTNTIIEIIRQSGTNKNEWTWTKNEVLKESKAFMLSSIQSYQLKLYNMEDDLLLKNMQEIATEVLILYPDHVESLTNLALSHIIGKKYDQAIQILEKASKVNDKDCIVLNNLAYCYRMKGDKQKAISYYKKVVEIGSGDEKFFAEEQVRELSK